MEDDAVARVGVRRTRDLAPSLLSGVRQLLLAAFGQSFSDDDWQHALGGWHVLVQRDDLLLSHAAVVPRELHVRRLTVQAGYVEAVATDPARQGQGFGALALRGADSLLRREHEMGALSTGVHGFYERAGWERWRGPTYVRHAGGLRRTADEDDGIMVLRYGRTAAVDLSLPISCPARPGDDW